MYTINFKPIISVLSVGIPLISCALIPIDHTATAKLPDDLAVSMTLRPLPSIQSDWERRLTIQHQNETVSTSLFFDTGWWRGANLYRHASGSLVLYEGKNSCIEFRLNPINFIQSTDRASNCDDFKIINNNERNINKIKSENYFIPSKYFADLYYIGTFKETSSNSRRKRIHFHSFEKFSEPDL